MRLRRRSRVSFSKQFGPKYIFEVDSISQIYVRFTIGLHVSLLTVLVQTTFRDSRPRSLDDWHISFF